MRRVLSCIVVLLLLAFPCHALTAHFVDVGQGDATLFRFDDGKHMIVDVGPTDAGERLVSYLRSVGVVSLDIVVLIAQLKKANYALAEIDAGVYGRSGTRGIEF